MSPEVINKRAFLITLVFLLVTTAIFDSLMIAAGLVGYDTELILNVFIGKAPIEDFAYSVVAALFVPYFWERFGKQ